MENLVYLGVGLTVGLPFGVMLGYVLWGTKAVKANPVQKKPLACGSCLSPITEDPIQVVITDHDSFRLFRCRSCGTHVTAPVT